MAKKVKGFEDFNIEGEKEKLQKIKRSFKPNSNQTNEGMSGDISKLIKRKLDGKNLSQKDFLKLHNWMMENDEDYCKSVDKQMSKDLKKLVPKNTEIKNEGIFSDEGHAGMNGERYIDEKSYNEEEVLELLVKMNEWPTTFDGEDEVKEWFEEFKK
jgi:hypothetical protein